jgi:hypothetical protein
VQRFQEWQAAQRRRKAEQEKMEVLQASLMAEAAVEEQEAAFHQYASALLAETRRRGLDTRPLEKYVNSKPDDLKASLC